MNIKYLTVEQLFVIHQTQINEFGGNEGIRDINLLESAVLRPQSSFGGEDLYNSIYDKAAALVHSVISNHAFIDGNKRTGMVSGAVFLEMNGYELKVNQEDYFDTAMRIANKQMNIKEISEWLKKNSEKIG